MNKANLIHAPVLNAAGALDALELRLSVEGPKQPQVQTGRFRGSEPPPQFGVPWQDRAWRRRRGQ